MPIQDRVTVAVIGDVEGGSLVLSALVRSGFQIAPCAVKRPADRHASWPPEHDVPDAIVMDLLHRGADLEDVILTAEDLAVRTKAPILAVATPDIYPLDRAFALPVYGYIQPSEIDSHLEFEVRSTVKMKSYRTRLEAVLHATGHAVFAVDAKGYNVETSMAELAMLGYADPDELIGKLRAETHWLFPEDRKRFVWQLRKENGKVKDYLAVFKKKGGREPLWIRGNCRIERDKHTGARRVVGFYQDVTESQLREIYRDALARIRNDCRRVDDAPPIAAEAIRHATFARAVAVLAYDATNDVLIVCSMAGVSSEERLRLSGAYAPRAAALSPTNGANDDTRTDGLVSWLLARAPGEEVLMRPVGGAADPLAYACIIGDKNPVEGSRAMQALDAFLSELDQALRTVSTLQINRLYQAMHNAKREHGLGMRQVEAFLKSLLASLQKEVPFEGASIFHVSRTDARLRLAATTGIAGNQARVRYEIGHGLTGKVAQEKSVRIVLDVQRLCHSLFAEEVSSKRRFWIGVPILHPSGELMGVLRAVNREHGTQPGVLSPFLPWDVQALEAAAMQVELILSVLTAEEQRHDLLARVTHEIRAPANSIRANLDNLRARYPERAKFEQKCDDLELEAAALLDLARTLDALFGPRGAQPRNAGPTDVRSVLLSIVHLMKPELREHRFDLGQIEIQPSSFPSLRMSKTALHQLLWNLFQNAIRYAKPDAPAGFKVQIAGDVTPRRSRIFFRDWGIGILPADQERVFEPGVRGDNAQLASVRGSGLGLSICRQIVRECDGSIVVTRLRDPTELTVTFPLHRIVP